MYVGTFCICEAGNNMVITLENQHYIHYITQYSGNVQKIVKYHFSLTEVSNLNPVLTASKGYPRMKEQ